MFGLRFNDNSSRLMLLANILALIIALYLGYSIAMMIWLYWFESLMVGAFTLLAIIAALRQEKTQGWKLALASTIFFVFNYGVFHLAYVIVAPYFPSLGFDWARLYDLAPAAVLLMIPQALSFYENEMGRTHTNTAAYVAAHVSAVYSRVMYIAMILVAAAALKFYFGSESDVLFAAMLVKLFADMRIDEAKRKKLAIVGSNQ
ncbi:MAG: DUF6498-containing protein [Candidatus ainarchaeum sp.]|nr:DUF6498-containing protein [Candidatus ainarchaeum sp.]